MAMACNNPVKDLEDEVTCPICLDSFKDPVSINCGHSFCRSCISQTWRGICSNFSCPQCRKISKWKYLRPNRLVENVVEISNRLLVANVNQEHGKRCKKHQELLKFYCRVDAEEICVICRESVYHRTHAVIPVEESTKTFEVELKDRLQALRKEVADIVQSKSEEDEKALKLQGEVVQKRKSVTAEFEALRQHLADQELTLAHRLEQMEKNIVQRRNESITRLNKKLSSLQKVIIDLEKNCVSLKGQTYQELKTSLSSRSEVLSKSITRNQHANAETLDYFKTFTVPVSLDLKTVNPNLLVTCNKKCVQYTDIALNLVPCPERFDSKPCVLATTGYRSGKRYWEVEVGGGVYWTIGVARQSVHRRGAFKIEPSGGIWAIGLLGLYTDRYYAFTNPDTLLNPRKRPERIGIFLNCDEGYISFYNAVNLEHLFTFKSVKVFDTMFPFFCVGAMGTELRLD
ncbi:E3 ubiquitin-protein ligase TRIM39-like [Mixophyes fleayi]|uniref:E3 ubiquitin-protein ligase TRIM39-like n=1 Tax=Mixophyes fleayi TaxID=3061075 RepID=UPI003F4DEB72